MFLKTASILLSWIRSQLKRNWPKGDSINLISKHSKMLLYLPRYVLEPIYIYKVKKCKMLKIQLQHWQSRIRIVNDLPWFDFLGPDLRWDKIAKSRPALYWKLCGPKKPVFGIGLRMDLHWIWSSGSRSGLGFWIRNQERKNNQKTLKNIKCADVLFWGLQALL